MLLPVELDEGLAGGPAVLLVDGFEALRLLTGVGLLDHQALVVLTDLVGLLVLLEGRFCIAFFFHDYCVLSRAVILESLLHRRSCLNRMLDFALSD